MSSSVTVDPPEAKPDRKLAYDFELNWYDFETRTRKLVFDLLQPSVTRAAEDRELLFKYGRQIDLHKQRLEQVEYSLFSADAGRTTVFEVIDQRFVDIETERKV